MAAASLGSATGSRVDSAAKHTMPCKLDGRFFRAGLAEGSEFGDNTLHALRNQFMMQKDEIVMNTTKKFQSNSGSQAYPLVITTLGQFADAPMRDFLLELYSSASVHDFTQFSKSKSEPRTAWQTSLTPSDLETFKKKMEYLPDFRCQGVALGQAFASHLSGDTVATVLVGGMATVMNGHFEMFSGILQRRVVACVVTSAVACISNTVSGAGDDVQWYFDFEKPKFQAVTNHLVDQGCRILNGNRNDILDKNTQLHQNKKMKFFDHRLMGSQSGIGNSQGMKSGDTVFRIKPYRPSVIKENNSMFSMPHYGDKIRVFAKCIVGGRPGDMVDIMIMTQSS